jgi:bifunctional non-homologous end joining protein LigD
MSPAKPATICAGQHTIEISHPDKALFTDPTVTKLDLAHHYERVAPAMIPHVRDRPLALEAYPRGIAQKGYYLKSIPDHFPEWIKRVTVPKRGGTLTQVVADSTSHAGVPRRTERHYTARLALAGRPAAAARQADPRLRPLPRRRL